MGDAPLPQGKGGETYRLLHEVLVRITDTHVYTRICDLEPRLGGRGLIMMPRPSEVIMDVDRRKTHEFRRSKKNERETIEALCWNYGWDPPEMGEITKVFKHFGPAKGPLTRHSKISL
jgi:hypothetical protein